VIRRFVHNVRYSFYSYCLHLPPRLLAAAVEIADAVFNRWRVTRSGSLVICLTPLCRGILELGCNQPRSITLAYPGFSGAVISNF
jgi:hypothetical protein